MAGSDENSTGMIKPSSIQGELRSSNGGKINAARKDGQQRRALSIINRNTVGAPAPYPCVVNKKEVSTQKDTVSSKNSPSPVFRPKKRKLDAQIPSTKRKPHIEETEQVQSFPHATVLVEEEVGISSNVVEDCKTTDDYPVPMSVQHSEALLLEEINQIVNDEVVKLDVPTDEPAVDIDLNDKSNPLAVAEYIDDIYFNYRALEVCGSAQPNYMEHQLDISEKMRAILVDWLIEVHCKFGLWEETLFLTINIIDRFLSLNQSLMRTRLQLVGVTAMLIASKYEQLTAPSVQDFTMICDRTYTEREVLDMETLMILTLNFNISVPTPYVFMRRFLKAAAPESDKKLELLSFFIIELCLVEYEMLNFPPSLLAAAAIFTAQCSLYGSRQWSKTCEKHTNYTQEQLLECSKSMVNLHQKSNTGKLTGVYRKYSTSKYGYAAKSSAPALQLLQSSSSSPSSSSSSSTSKANTSCPLLSTMPR